MQPNDSLRFFEIYEWLSFKFSSIYPDTNFLGLRFFNIFGPYQDPHGAYAAVIPRWISTLCSNKKSSPPVIYGDGSATRDFCHVSNICDLINLLVSTDRYSLLKKNHNVYNIGTGKSVTLSSLYSLITSLLISSNRLTEPILPDHRPWRSGDILHSCSSISKASEDLGFFPQTDLETGLVTH